MTVLSNHIVRIEYELKVKGGEVIESSEKSGPLEYVHGQGKLLPALERRLDGMAVGEEKHGEIAAAEAFGNHDALPIRELPRREFPASEKLTVGRIFEAKTPGEDSVRFVIVAAEGDLVKVRFLHPLQDKDLEFRVKVLSVEPPRRRRQSLLHHPPPPPADAFGIESGAIRISAEDSDD